MKLDVLLNAVNLNHSLNQSIEIRGIAEHTNNISDDYLFILASNNLEHAKLAKNNGAVALLISNTNPLAADPRLKSLFSIVVEVEDLTGSKTKILQYFYNAYKSLDYIAVTGTNGKTTVVNWCADILAKLNKSPGVIGTLGASINERTEYHGLTTPNQSRLYELVDDMARANVDSVVFEASSHALDQGRAKGLPVGIAAFTNLSQDHLDYHKSMIEYFTAKTKLFSEFPIKKAVINLDDALLFEYVDKLKLLGIDVLGITTNPELKLPKGIKAIYASNVKHLGAAIQFDLNYNSNTSSIDSSAIVDFKQCLIDTIGIYNLNNALCAAALAFMATNDLENVIGALNSLRPVSGRLEMVKVLQKQPRVYVDFAHTPTGLAKALQALKPSVAGKLHVVFGCGGNRDKEKRPMMLQAACDFADVVYLTQDNSREEDPQQIFKDTMAEASEPSKINVILDRRDAIKEAIHKADNNDTVLVAGRGHETIHDLGKVKLNFTDKEAIENVLEEMEKNEEINS